MATYLHVTPALALAVVIGPQRVPWPWWLVGALVAVAPDADMLLVRWHIDVYGGTYGHRGFTHSLDRRLHWPVSAVAPAVGRCDQPRHLQRLAVAAARRAAVHALAPGAHGGCAAVWR